MANVNDAHKGDLVLIKLAEEATTPGVQEVVLCLTSLEPSFEMEAIDLAPCRGDTANSNWRRRIPSTNSGSIDGEGYVKMANDWEPKRFFDVIDTQKRVDFTIFHGNPSTNAPIPGGMSITGKAWLTSFSVSAPSEDVVTYSFSLAIDGKPAMTIIT
jgi:predicted secreted protein